MRAENFAQQRRSASLSASLVAFGCVLMLGCVSKHRFAAEYEAPRSALKASVRSAVVVRDAETLVGNRAYAVIDIAPIGEQPGTRFRFGAALDQTEVAWLEEAGKKRVSWSNSQPLVQLLTAHGYSRLNQAEIDRLNHALLNSLSSPKGFVLEGQGREIKVLKANIDYDADFDDSKPIDTWIAAPPAAEASELVISTSSDRVHLVLDNQPGGSVDVTAFAAQPYLSSARIVSEIERGGSRYVVFVLHSMSRPGSPNGYCGAGIESNLVWIALDSKRHIVTSGRFLVASCFESFYPPDAWETLTGAEFFNAVYTGPNGTFSIRYDTAKPENGLHKVSLSQTQSKERKAE